jgi:hypothetical protein
MRVGILVLAAVFFFLAGPAVPAADETPLSLAQGTVDKATKDMLTIRPRGPDGKFQPSVALKVTGTSKVTTITTQMRSGKVVVVQKDTDAKDVERNQAIAVIYTTLKDGSVLLAAVVQMAEK